MPQINYPLQKEKIKISAEECFKLGEQKGYFILDKGKIKYTAVGKSYNFSDPEEKTRMMFYFDLIEKYKYPVNRIEFEVGIFDDKAINKYADIVVFTNDEQRKPYIVVKCEKDGIADLEFEEAVKRVIANAWNLGALFAACVAGDKYRVVEIDDKNNKTEIDDLPICYGEK
ncbi:MAG: type I restriction enzyme HsdR N-terminal domain-containing protein [Candidatus Pacebacteria bacterium]|nr:type I restriction enzyme HsdR N-terminal domain-containing protein [Candidatus Paceibacterota bacterium]